MVSKRPEISAAVLYYLFEVLCFKLCFVAKHFDLLSASFSFVGFHTFSVSVHTHAAHTSQI